MMTIQTTKSTAEWNFIWLSKLERIAIQNSIDPQTLEEMKKNISRFLENFPGSPYYVPLHKLREYLVNSSNKDLEAILYFYEHVGISKSHSELIRKLDIETPEDKQTTMKPSQLLESPCNKDSQNEEPCYNYLENKQDTNCSCESPSAMEFMVENDPVDESAYLQLQYPQKIVVHF